ncbi:hypothetical protein COEX109129_19200 [Corallococcus exiguus]
MTAMPRPGPTPSRRPMVLASTPPSRMAGSKMSSASGPAMRLANGDTQRMTIRFTAAARPWRSEGILRCQMDWMPAITGGMVNR